MDTMARTQHAVCPGTLSLCTLLLGTAPAVAQPAPPDPEPARPEQPAAGAPAHDAPDTPEPAPGPAPSPPATRPEPEPTPAQPPPAPATQPAAVAAPTTAAEVAPAGKKVDAASAEPHWSDHIKVKGDLRYRIELIDRTGQDLRHRHRIRARFGLHVNVATGLDAVVQVGTGADDTPVSNNQSLDEAFSSKPLWLDLGYFDFHPELAEGLHLYGGKMKNPLYSVGKSELLWDPDLNPEGLSLQYKPTFGIAEPFATGVFFWVQEHSSEDDSFITGGQAGLKLNFESTNVYALAGGRYIDFRDIIGDEVYWDPTDAFGNSATDRAGDGVLHYDEDYNIAGGFLEVGGKLVGLPWAVFGDVAQNLEANDDNLGWLVGVRAGGCKQALDFCLRYIYREVEADAVVGIFTDSDFKGGGTDGRGHEWNGGLQLAKRATFAVTYFYNQTPLEDSNDYHRVQFDLKMKF